MYRRSQLLFAASLLAVVVASSHAWSGEKHRRTIYCQPIPTCCRPATCQTNSGPAPTCCQPVAASIGSSASPIELCAHAQPAPRRLTPQPDALEINPTLATTFCAEFVIFDYGTYKSYYAKNCATQMPATINGNNLGPLPGDCNMPNGACVTVGSSVVPTAFETNGSQPSGSFTLKGTKLAKKLKAGVKPLNQPNPQATKPRELKERKPIGQPIFAQFPRVVGSSELVVVELQKYSVKWIGQAGREHSGTITVGVEIDQAPAGKAVKEFNREQISVTDDHVARIEIGNATFDIVTASKLTP